MATRTWGAGVGMDGNWSTATNWTGSVKPGVGDDVVFDNTDDTNCLFDENTANLGSIDVQAGYDGDIDFNDFDITTSGNQAYDGTGTVKCGTGTISCGGNFDYIHQGTWNDETSVIDMTGNGTIFANGSANIYGLTISANVTLQGGITLNVEHLIVVIGKTVTIDGSLIPAASADISGTVSINAGKFFTTGSSTSITGELSGDGTWLLAQGGIVTDASGTIEPAFIIGRRNFTLAAGTYGNAATVTTFEKNTAGTDRTVTLSAGTFIFPGVVTFDCDVVGPRIFTIDAATNDVSVEFRKDVTFSETGGGVFVWSKAATGTVKFGGTTIYTDNTVADQDIGIVSVDGTSLTLATDMECSSFTVEAGASGDVDLNDQDITCSGNMTFDGNGTVSCGSGTIICSGNFDNKDQATWTKGTGIIKLSGAGAGSQTIDFGGKSIQSLTVDDAGATKVISAAGYTTVNLIFSAGTIDHATNDPSIAISGTVTFAGPATWTRGTGTITLSGAGAGTQDIDFDGNAIEALIMNDAGATKRISAAGFITAELTLTAGTWDNATNDPNYAVAGNVSFAPGVTYTRGTGTIMLFGATAGNQTIDFAGKTIEELDVNDAGATKIFSATGYTTTNLILTAGTVDHATNNPTIVISGTVFFSGPGIWTRGTGAIVLSGAGAGTQDIQFNGKTIEAIVMADAGAQKRISAAGFATAALTLTAGRWNNATNDPTIIVNGDITFSVGAVYDEGTGIIGLDGAGAGTQTIDFNGDTIENLVVNDAGAIKQFTAPFTVASVNGVAGIIDTNGQTILCAGVWAMSTGAGFFTPSLPGTALFIGANSAWDTVNLNSGGAWAITQAAGTLVITNSTITDCDASGGNQIDATTGCVDGGGNTNIDFGVVPPPAVDGATEKMARILARGRLPRTLGRRV